MKLRAHGLTDVGRKAEANEDCFLVDAERGLFVVSDGVGRYRGAAIASRCVVDTVAAHFRGRAPAAGEARRRFLLEAPRKAAAALVAEGKRKRELATMAATLTALLVEDGEAHVVHVGDSRAYLRRGGRLEQLTRDHSLAFEQYEAGAITKEAVRTHPNQGLLTRTIRASSSLVLPELGTLTLCAGDVFLLCTDGLPKELSDDEIAARLRGDDLATIARGLVDATNAAGGRDNVTIVLVAID